ncbi:hypothetical protein SUGI_0490130 [Cryptomeria japonica]|nr:hypothetical protein SUGI_0490130 [Cryptomeria japonica]
MTKSIPRSLALSVLQKHNAVPVDKTPSIIGQHSFVTLPPPKRRLMPSKFVQDTSFGKPSGHGFSPVEPFEGLADEGTLGDDVEPLPIGALGIIGDPRAIGTLGIGGKILWLDTIVGIMVKTSVTRMKSVATAFAMLNVLDYSKSQDRRQGFFKFCL